MPLTGRLVRLRHGLAQFNESLLAALVPAFWHRDIEIGSSTFDLRRWTCEIELEFQQRRLEGPAAWIGAADV